MTEIKLGGKWRKAYDKYCTVCEGYFLSLAPHGKYCSDKCKELARKSRKSKKDDND